MDWKEVGSWIQNNAGAGAALVGSLLTGNVPGAVAAGVSLVSSATGHATPDAALAALKGDPQTVIKLKELANANEASIREHVRAMTELQLKDAQAAQETTAKVTISGDNSQDIVVRRTRPLQSWVSLVAAFVYVAACMWTGQAVDKAVLLALLTLPWAYAGLRQVGKGIDSIGSAIATVKTLKIK